MRRFAETEKRRNGETEIARFADSPIRRFAVSLAIFAAIIHAVAQPAPPPETNALVQLMLSQPQMDITTPVTATAIFDPPVVRPGERAVYRVTFNAIESSVHWPQELPAPRNLELRPSAQAQIVPVVGGAYRPTASFVFSARASRAGIFSVPAFYVEVYGKPVIVPEAHVEALLEMPEPHPGARQLVVTSERTNVFLGETLRVKVQYASSSPNLVEAVSQVELRGDGVLEDKNSVRQSIELLEHDGQRTPTFSYETSVTPLAMGALKLKAQGFTSGREFNGTIIIRGPVTIPGGPPQYVLLDSEPFTINVRPLPEAGRLPGFSGAIGSFRCDPPKLGTNQVRVGDPVQITYTLRGEGDLTQLSPPAAPRARGWQIFPPDSGVIENATGTNRAIAFTYTLIPLSDAEQVTPMIPFSGFDAKKNAYTDLSFASVPIIVLNDGLTTNLDSFSSSSDANPETEPKLALSSLSLSPGRAVGSLVPWQMRAWFPFAQISPALVFLALWGWVRRRDYLERHPEIVRRRRARRALRREFRALRRAAGRNDEAEFSRRAVSALQIVCSPHFPAEPRALVGSDVVRVLDSTGLNGQAAQLVERLFANVNRSRFSAELAHGDDVLKARAEVEAVLKKLEEQL